MRPRLEAQDRMKAWVEGKIELHPNAVYEMVLTATEDEERAQTAFSSVVRRGLKPKD